MIGNDRVLALVPARSGSKGLVDKNIRTLGDRPLLAWPVRAAQASALVDRVVVSTDSPAYADIATRHGADVPFIRPAELAGDTTPSCDVIIHALDHLDEDYSIVVLLEPTAPLTSATDVDAAIRSLIESDADAVVGIKALEGEHPAYAFIETDDGHLAPYDSGRTTTALPRRQDLSPAFALSGSLYISRVERYRRDRSFVHDGTIGHELPPHRSVEIDSLLDFIVVESVLNHLAELDGQVNGNP